MNSTVNLIAHINVKLALLGYPPVATADSEHLNDIVSTLVAQYREKERLLANHLCPVDHRIQTFLYDYLQNVPVAKLPLAHAYSRTARHGASAVAAGGPRRVCSGILNSYRVKQGVLHNPRSDRRTTQGIFHVTEGGLPIPDDKIGVPKNVFAKMLGLALNPPREIMRLPFTATQPKPAECFVSLLMRPIVCPEVPGFTPERPWKSVSSRRATWSATWISWRAFLATPAIRTCRKMTPASTRNIGRATPAA